ncbi:beta-N-acetylhexosaminidase [Solemya velum gill symbiont]|uniref:beta-N-acetylhexosaminidase n=1 Tax=Solemya velum gill symbiont TaxID=2340 RepID=UPI000997EEEE|nr:beta-N-acetylhexosaminidase [Solemya velum gill symbiont]OOZ44323.1 beta-N-acetylhexosaminidase [Solemya velum gill symbiont]OOZ46572.1 beta-N-acetylhexosaminidase [Solemya velum gill symbiont]OOZ48893.1 beta-N-acetylhexosaminidase [Solemya velum gill symbiont]OOZ51380.1 beta-N-acetylhexosaminidase [Solemya velum gill symbiont]OOZ53955.1 beta-N-acetylhexosaminidase [Solemya velum gill symbiont]
MTIGPVMLDLVGTTLLDEDIERLVHPASGGIILFSRNYESPEQLHRLISRVRKVAGREYIIAVDHEGGRVQRFRNGFTRIPPMAWLGDLYQKEKSKALEYAHELGWLMAAELRDYDIDISFAPVLDLDFGICDVIGDRAFQSDPLIVTNLAGAFIAGMHEVGMLATGKHFPGHGAVSGDSHLELPVDSRLFVEIGMADLIPFERLVQKGLDAIMPAHVIYESCDPNPAGFSPYWLQQVLRKQLGFDGVIFSDDLTMEGAAFAGTYPERANAAFTAGCDMVLVCNNQQAAEQVLESIKLPLDEQVSARLEKMLGAHVEIDLTGHRWMKAVEIAAEGVNWAQERECDES